MALSPSQNPAPDSKRTFICREMRGSNVPKTWELILSSDEICDSCKALPHECYRRTGPRPKIENSCQNCDTNSLKCCIDGVDTREGGKSNTSSPSAEASRLSQGNPRAEERVKAARQLRPRHTHPMIGGKTRPSSTQKGRDGAGSNPRRYGTRTSDRLEAREKSGNRGKSGEVLFEASAGLPDWINVEGLEWRKCEIEAGAREGGRCWPNIYGSAMTPSSFCFICSSICYTTSGGEWQYFIYFLVSSLKGSMPHAITVDPRVIVLALRLPEAVKCKVKFFTIENQFAVWKLLYNSRENLPWSLANSKARKSGIRNIEFLTAHPARREFTMLSLIDQRSESLFDRKMRIKHLISKAGLSLCSRPEHWGHEAGQCAANMNGLLARDF
ncbi:hypothetical protein CONPUDRAFT_70325 [Coniophora puteana RWD-64-598 SS2]|uniref:Uncharacterized protein n=1 Tax=Coniophora puteana (strain RWD-64-598) TaxID=741705 RepID=A0A5M3N3E7_CONPW|nr:uncharacterized protein CONPUDRAFT_70325 [Coniophora puteana RWD-64-598 SS2]EIW85544.1 hypothetical protein CONPUDRAFT_70325 [Coniophora puteana RWD-64-598 SS2]